jgi:tetratricopeptide (TPR) repeat protein
VLAAVLATACGLAAQEASGPGFLMPLQPDPGLETFELRQQWQMEGIRTAIENGFTAVAATLVERLLAENPDGATLGKLLNYRFHIALLLDDLPLAGEIRVRMEAEGIEQDPLHEAFFLFFSGDAEAAQALVPQPGSAIADPAESAWFRLLEALLLSRSGEVEAANLRFEQAALLAPNELVRNQFEIIRFREELGSGSFDDATISALRESVRSMRGERAGFEAARLLAIALNRAGQSQQAIEVLNTHLSMQGLREFGLRSDFLLLMAVVSGPESARGRLALRQIVAEGGSLDQQAIAFTLLARNSVTTQSRDELLADIDQWLRDDIAPGLTDLLLAYQAYFHSRNGNFQSAAESARALLDGFPSSEYRDTALWLQAFASWNQAPPRYRTAADYLNQLRQSLSDPERLLKTGILIADCYFLNGDYASASDAYGAVLREATPEYAARVFFQRVLSEIRADRPTSAGELIDTARDDPRLDEEVIWRAEWNLLDYLRREGRTDLAFDRIGRNLGATAALSGLSEALQLRLRWLEARLSLEAGSATEAIQRAETLLQELSGGAFNQVPEVRRREVESHLLLLLGEARIAGGLKPEGLASFATLRERYPRSGPTILSYLVESRSETVEDNLVNAQQSLVGLVDRFPTSEYAPIALWEAALNAEQRGLNIHLQEAIGLLERLVTEYPGHELVYYARLKQGDLARRLNDFPTALLLYERILAQFPDHPERYRAELSRADCLMALGSEDPDRFDMAAVIYERNCLLPAAQLPVRMEAGYKWGHSLRQLGDRDGCEAVFWLIYERFAKDPEMVRPVLNDEAARYWLARILVDLADLQLQKGEVAKGRRIYESILTMKLPGAALAATRLNDLP